ncbi:hydrogenase maturation protease [Mucilaginibacter sp.]|uniref:hydrogenase maturation protease n=1 Tax=Mucilaginibacter sp. TaxID=1882438 RepID=UPI00283BD0C8|nr:hydrogenase maturation protease [Mucilaginibacter sp.]MDR3695943.1 hydrogenase maturation protease [Mucilaginibacter sp.]
MKHGLSSSKILLIGIGNEFREDDGLGLYICRHDKIGRLQNLVIKENSGDGMTMMDAWKDEGTVVLIDAVRSGRAAGTIFHFDLLKDPLPPDLFNISTHNIGIPDCIILSEKLGLLPEKLIFYGVEGKNFGHGKKLSPVVKTAADILIDQIFADCESGNFRGLKV